MAGTVPPAFLQTSTGPGTSHGYLPVADTSGYVLLARAWLVDQTGANNVECIIVEIPSATSVGLRFVNSQPENYGRSDLTSPHLYDTGSTLNQYPNQLSNFAPGFDGN